MRVNSIAEFCREGPGPGVVDALSALGSPAVMGRLDLR
ncbi:hypothetical protein SynRS9902_01434 [Synechococcus sp. RS9902]|nr:hypothetical protein SynRS9902_01434 [Synechococcus sp. RS9902]